MKMDSGVVTSYLEYYAMCKKRDPKMALQVAENMQILIAIEKSERTEAVEFSPLPSMIKTLEDYCIGGDFDLDPEEIKTKLGGVTSKYY